MQRLSRLAGRPDTWRDVLAMRKEIETRGEEAKLGIERSSRMKKGQLTIGTSNGHAFRLPIDLVTSTQAILARKRSGKSYLAADEAEEMLEHKQQIVAIDPTGAWWGLRSSADGKGEGYPIVVFGGDHGDAPLDFQGGKAMARAVVEQGFSAIFDIGNLDTEEQIKFVSDFCSELLRINRHAMHVFMDEADTFAPQTTESKLQKVCLGTVSRLVKQGGVRGVGFTMITQRSADINKKILSQVDLLTVLRMSHPLDIRPAADWIMSQVNVEFAQEVEKALPSLPVGMAFFCSASLGLGERVEVRKRRTFNSGATPKPGERKIEPKVLAKIDIAKLGRDISAAVQRSKEESPEYLKAEIERLTREAKRPAKEDSTAMADLFEQIEELKGKAAEADRLRELLEESERLRSNDGELRAKAAAALQTAMAAIESIAAALEQGSAIGAINLPPPPAVIEDRQVSASLPAPAVRRSEDATNELSPARQRILDALSLGKSMGRPQLSKLWVSMFANASPTSSAFTNNLGGLRSVGLIEYVDGEVRLTDAGAERAKQHPRISMKDATAILVSRLEPARRRIMEVLLARRGDPIAKDELATQINASPTSSAYTNNLGGLRSLKMLDYTGDRKVFACADLFDRRF